MQVEVWGTNAGRSMKTLALSYLENSTGDFEVAHGMENCVDQWGKHTELVVQKLFEVE